MDKDRDLEEIYDGENAQIEENTADMNREVLTENQFDKMVDFWQKEAAGQQAEDQEFGVDDMMKEWGKMFDGQE